MASGMAINGPEKSGEFSEILHDKQPEAQPPVSKQWHLPVARAEADGCRTNDCSSRGSCRIWHMPSAVRLGASITVGMD